MPFWSEGLGDYTFGQLDLSLEDAGMHLLGCSFTKRMFLLSSRLMFELIGDMVT